MKKDHDYENDFYPNDFEDYEDIDIPDSDPILHSGAVPAEDFNRRFQKRGIAFEQKGKYIAVAVLLILFCSVAAGVSGYRLGYSRSFSRGYDAGYEEGSDLGYNEGMELGKDDGYDIGYEDGYADGADGAQNDAYYGVLEGSSQISAGSGDTVYCTASGSCYHYEGCSYIANKSGLKTMSEADAVSSGYSPCSRCGK